MTRRPNDREPEPPGGRAAERLREFMGERFPGGIAPTEGPPEDVPEAQDGVDQADGAAGEGSGEQVVPGRKKPRKK